MEDLCIATGYGRNMISSDICMGEGLGPGLGLEHHDEGSDEPDSAPSSIKLSPCPSSHRSDGGFDGNDNDAGYCSQDQMTLQDSNRDILSINEEYQKQTSVVNQSHSREVSNVQEDANGNVSCVTIPPKYCVRSNSRGTIFTPGYDEAFSGSLDSLISDGTEESTRLTEEQNNAINKDVFPSCTKHAEGGIGDELGDRLIRDCSNVCETNSRTHAADHQRVRDMEVTKARTTAGTGISPRKRKASTSIDGDAEDSEILEATRKKMRGGDLSQRHPVKVPRSRAHACGGNAYDIQGQANWIVQSPEKCTFHIYQSQGSEGQVKQHPVDWAGVSIHQVTDEKMKAAFQEVSKAISQATQWKRFARMLPVSHSPTLEEELGLLDSCQGSSQDKALAVLLRWWSKEYACRVGREIQEHLREGLEDCGLKRAARDVGRIFGQNIP